MFLHWGFVVAKVNTYLLAMQLKHLIMKAYAKALRNYLILKSRQILGSSSQDC